MSTVGVEAIAVGAGRGHKVTKRERKAKQSRRAGVSIHRCCLDSSYFSLEYRIVVIWDVVFMPLHSCAG